MRILLSTFEAFFEHKRDSMIRVMELLLLSLLVLSAGVHALLNTIFDGSIPSSTQWRVFIPEYLTLVVAYGLLRTKWLKLATHVFLLGMIITQMSVIFFMTGPMSYIYVSYTNVVLIAGLILGPGSAALYTGMIIALMYLYFNAIRTGQLDMMLLSQIPYGAQMQMVATQACFIFTGLTVSYFIVRQSRLHDQMVKEQARTKETLQDLQQAETLNAIQAKQDSTIGWMGQQFIQTEYPQSFFETTLPKVFDTIPIRYLLINCPSNQLRVVLASQDPVTNQVQTQFIRENEVQQALAQHDEDSIRTFFEQHSLKPVEGIVNIHRESNSHQFDRTCTIVTVSEEPLEHVDTFFSTLSNMFTAVLQRAQTESQLRQLQKMETLNRVAGSVAHDFNNLLMSIMSSTDFALSQVERDEVLYNTLLQINWASERGKALTRKLLSFSRSESFEPKSICVHNVIQEMIPIIKQITRDSIALHIECTSYEAHIQIDQQDFENALLNLLINARDAIKDIPDDENSITIGIQTIECSEKSTVSISISDTGSGIPESQQSKVLEPFFTTKPKGTGLGLSMVRSVVERAHGTISIYSSAEGSTISMRFPLAEYTDQSQTSICSSPSSIEPSYALLIVDDEPLVRQMLAEYLSRHHFNTYMAENVDHAKKILKSHSIDLILSDVNMPGESGLKLHKYCQTHHPETHFILMTGFTNEAIDDSIIVLSKPMRMPALLQQIQQVIRHTVVDA